MGQKQHRMSLKCLRPFFDLPARPTLWLYFPMIIWSDYSGDSPQLYSVADHYSFPDFCCCCRCCCCCFNCCNCWLCWLENCRFRFEYLVFMIEDIGWFFFVFFFRFYCFRFFLFMSKWKCIAHDGATGKCKNAWFVRETKQKWNVGDKFGQSATINTRFLCCVHPMLVRTQNQFCFLNVL